MSMTTRLRLIVLVCALSLVGVWGSAVVGAKPVVIQMIQFSRVEEVAWQQAVVDRLNQEHTDIQVELIAFPDPRPYEKALTMWAAGMPPHISYGDPQHSLNWGTQGLLLDLEPFYQRDRDSSTLGEFFPAALDMHTIDGKRYGIPIDLQVQAFFYAKHPFDEAGLAYPDATWTWEHVSSIAKRLVVDSDGDGVPNRWAMRDPQWLHWWSVLWHFGGEVVDDPKFPTAFTGDSQEIQAALQWFYGMIQELGVMPRVGTVRGSTAQNLLIEQNIAMGIGSSLYQQEANQYVTQLPWDVAPLPQGPAGNTAFANALGWVVFQDAGDHEAVWEVLKFFSSEEAMQLAVETRGTLVPHIPTTRDVWQSYHNVPENRHVFIDAINTARPLPVLYDRGLDAVSSSVTAYWNGLLPLAQATENMRRGVSDWITAFHAGR